MKRFCGDCAYFLVLSCPPDPPLYFCNNDRTKDLIPPIGWLRGPNAPGCKFFVPVDSLVSSGRPGSRKLTLKELFLQEPEQFIDVPTAAHLLRKSKKSVYRYVEEGLLAWLRVGGTIFIYRPSILKLIGSDEAA